jgi:two-component system, cell cycle sensor histidine kinase and response regulator CckA
MDKKPTYEELMKKFQELEQKESGRENDDSVFFNRESFLRTFIETIPDLVWLKDPDGVYLACNRKFELLYGVTEKEIVGKTDYDFVSKERADFFRKNDLAAIASGKTTKNEESVTFADDGHEELLETLKTPMFAPNGKLLGVLGIARDITERKHIERELRHSKERLQMTLEVANIGIWDWHVMNDTWYASSTYYTMLGYDPVPGPSDREIWLKRVHPEDREMVKKRIGGILHFETNEYRYEARMKHADGSYHWHYVTGHVLERDNDNKPIHLTGLRIDIDEHKKSEEEKEKLRTQLTQAQKMEAIGRLAGGVAHDFNNMLGVILGQTDLLLLKLGPTQPLFAALQRIKKAAEKSAALTRQLLAFARKQTVSPKILDLNDVIENLTRMLPRIIGEDIHLVWAPEKKIWPVIIDSSQIDQILVNLCVNARDSITGIGKIVIETGNKTFDDVYIRGHQGFLTGDYVMVAVSDSGCGMDEEILNNIFEPFFTTKGEGKGTGLGLSTVYGIVKQNKGFINVYSEPGYGSTFKIYLPRHKDKGGKYFKETTPEPVEGGCETILVVEDNTDILNISKFILEEQGYVVLTASSPNKAQQLVKDFPGTVDLLITDVIMPEMNGRILSEKIKLLFPKIKILFMSGYTANVIARHGVLKKGINFIQKPFSMRELTAKVREVLRCGEKK